MGNLIGGIDYQLHKDVVPHPTEKSRFDPLYGFPDGREEKVMIATEEEMYSAKIPLELRDYCAHFYIDYLKCKREQFPWIYRCKHEKHAYLDCQYKEYLDRMKDYERERRLRTLEKKREEKERKAAGA